MISNALHWLAHRLDRSVAPCTCRVDAYRAGWVARRESDEKRARLLREEGIPGGLLEQAKREGRM